MLHQLRKLRHTLGRALCGVLVLAWLAAALQPCLMVGSPATHQAAATQMHGMHDCCLPSAQSPPATPHCSPLGCDAKSTDQQSADQQLLTRFLQLTSLALLLYIVLLTNRRVVLSNTVARAPESPPHPHPTLAYCTLLI